MKETAILTEKEAVELFIYFLATARVQIALSIGSI